MSSKHHSYKDTLHLISDILSFENSVEALEQQLSSDTVDWEQFVFIASDYLVLTTCYCRLQQKNLLDYLPKDLEEYLEEITSINRNRNTSLLKEIHQIAQVLNDNHINYVFLKGSAFLVHNYYTDLGERMLGDIDILIDENHIESSYQLLLNSNYKGTKQGISAKYFDHKHLPRLKSDVHLAALEVHKKVAIQSYNGILDAKAILDEKIVVDTINVPSNKHLLLHSIINFQANDSGYTFSRISMKSIYDVLVLKSIYGLEFDPIFKRPVFQHYFSIAKLFFKDFNVFKSNALVNQVFLIKLKHPLLRKITDSLIRKIQFITVVITSRIGFFLKNKSYRAAILKDYKRVFGLTKFKFF